MKNKDAIETLDALERTAKMEKSELVSDQHILSIRISEVDNRLAGYESIRAALENADGKDSKQAGAPRRTKSTAKKSSSGKKASMNDTIQKYHSELPTKFTKKDVIALLHTYYYGGDSTIEINANSLRAALRYMVESGLAEIAKKAHGPTLQIYRRLEN